MVPKKLLIITGLSGSGKSSVLHMLEDQGFFTVDNMPPGMLPELTAMLSQHPGTLEKGVGAVVDVRSAGLQTNIPQVLENLKSQGVSVQILFLEASDDVILKRYSVTRRRHPLGFMNSLHDGIQMEKKQLMQLRKYADRVIDTSRLTLAQLREEITAVLARSPAELQLMVSSFGYKYGMILDADFVFDVRFLVNPYYVESLKHLSGLDEAVRKYICNDRMTEIFLHQTLELFESIIPVYHLSGKNYLQIAFGCTGGRHRSVFAAEWMGEHLSHVEGIVCQVRHRDLERDEQEGTPA
ncbi:MAG: RNase adapter RapZ [Pyramidobacter sp.]|jgi:UPF0042 nucleotide-binding protein